MVNDNTKVIKIAIQGGPGSFNEEAARWYAQGHRIPKYDLVYSYTTEGVLRTVLSGEAERGVFAIQNSIGGMVQESIYSMAEHMFEIVDQFEIIVDHCLLVRPGLKLDDISTIMSHPQALAQCQDTLKYSYNDKEQMSGDGEWIDQATAAKALAEGDLPASTAVLASKVNADLYGLEIVDRALQDRPDNYTTFLFVKAKD